MTRLRIAFLMSFLLQISRVEGQELSFNEYAGAFDVIKTDTLVRKLVSDAEEFRLSVHPFFTYRSIQGYRDHLPGASIDERAWRNALKFDKAQERNRNLASYRQMLDEQFLTFDTDWPPTVLVSFDRQKGNYVIAEVAALAEGLEWGRMTFQKRIIVFIFDVSSLPISYKRFEVFR